MGVTLGAIVPVIPVVAAAVFVRHSLPIVSISAILALVFALSYRRSPRRTQAKRSPEDKAVQKTLTGVSLLLVVLAFLKK